MPHSAGVPGVIVWADGVDATLGGVPVMMTGPGIDYTGTTDSTTAMQAICDANPGVTIRMKNGFLKFSSITLSKGQWLDGMGWRDYRDYFGGFGNADWMVDSHSSGTVLRSTATSGNAITIADAVSSTEGSVANFILIGPGTGTSVGIAIGSSTAGVVHPRWHNVKVANFATGVKTMEVYEGSFYDLTVHGCVTPLSLYTNTNQNAFYGLDLMFNTGPAIIDSTSVVNAFYSPIAQSNAGSGFEVSGADNVWINPYFENNVGYGIDIIGDGNTIIKPKMAGTGDGINVQATADSTYLQGNFTGRLTDAGTNTIIMDPGYAGASLPANVIAGSGLVLRASDTHGNTKGAGTDVLAALTTGSYNSAMGAYAQMALTTGSFNSAMGVTAQEALTTGSGNSAMGMSAQLALTTGSNNSAMGYNAQATDGVTATIANLNRGIAIGYNAQNTASNTAVLGGTQPADRVTLCLGNYGETGSGRGGISLTNNYTNPSTNPAGGGILYSDAGSLKWRGSSGTVTTIAPA